MKSRFKHAFAVDPPGPAVPNEAQERPVEWLCRQVAKRSLTTPGLIALEMSRPLNYVGAHVMHFFEPAISALAQQATLDDYRHLAQFLEQRGSIEYICRRIEELEAEYDQKNRKRRGSKTADGSEKDS